MPEEETNPHISPPASGSQNQDGEEENLPKTLNPVLLWLGGRPRLIQILVWSLVAISVATGATLWLTGQLEPLEIGLGSLFIINLVGAATIFLPLPGILSVCAASAPALGLNLYWVVGVSALGSAIGEMTAYLAGYGLMQTKKGKDFRARYKSYDRVRTLMKKRGWAVLLLLAAIPNPVFDVAGIVAGSLSYRVFSFFGWVLLGKTLKYIATSAACFYAVDWLQRLFVPGL